jgi:hypothetical protein
MNRLFYRLWAFSNSVSKMPTIKSEGFAHIKFQHYPTQSCSFAYSISCHARPAMSQKLPIPSLSAISTYNFGIMICESQKLNLQRISYNCVKDLTSLLRRLQNVTIWYVSTSKHSSHAASELNIEMFIAPMFRFTDVSNNHHTFFLPFQTWAIRHNPAVCWAQPGDIFAKCYIFTEPHFKKVNKSKSTKFN